ncbi:protein of unknown function [Nitrospira japonica]|uniref:Uncharacterized protein n=1 Tax=Nitrospira japonica TaxID=1325564 RepID=A0A1W1I5D9_9BACT|nr:protein of unknown function [Nitrospira japonica]
MLILGYFFVGILMQRLLTISGGG